MWSAKVFYAAKRGVYIDKDLYYYRRRDNSIVGLDSKKGLSERIVTDEIPQIEKQIQFLNDIGQDEMADETAYFLYEKLLKYYEECYYGNNELQEELLSLINKHNKWAREYLCRSDKLSRRIVLFVSLYAFKLTIFLLHIKNRKKEL